MDTKKIIENRIEELKATLKRTDIEKAKYNAIDQLITNYNILNNVLEFPCPCCECEKAFSCEKAFIDFTSCKGC